MTGTLDPDLVRGRLAGILRELDDLEGVEPDEQYRRLDEAQRRISEVLASPGGPDPRRGQP